MNLDQIDKALADWHNRLQLAMENLLALDDMLTYKRLEGKDGLPRTPLSGVTKARVTPALETIHGLFEHIGALNRVVERAAELRKQVTWFRPSDTALREIEQLLMGPSIQMPSAQTPLAQRSLLSAAETARAITPERLLAVMTQAFEAARDVIFAVDAAWSRLEPKLGDCETEMAALQQQANALGEGTCGELVTARRKIEVLRGQIECDPLGASADLDTEVAPLLQRVRARLEQSAQQRNAAQANQEKARRLLAQLEETHRQCETALRECQEKVGNVAGLRAPLDPARIAELTQWLTTLETTWQEGRWQAAQVGLERWLKTAREYLNAEKTARDANNAPLEMRAELRGRLAALQAKAQARGLAGDASLSALALEANQIAQQKPLALERLSQLVAAYEQQLAARGKS